MTFLFRANSPRSFVFIQMENMVIISDHAQMDKVIKEERQYILNIIKQIKKTNCNVLLIQKSILRDAISDLAIHYLAKMKILIVKDVEREDVPFIAKVTFPFLAQTKRRENVIDRCFSFRLLVVNQLLVSIIFNRICSVQQNWSKK